VSLSRTGNTGGQKARDESTEAELSLGVDGALDVASGGDQSVKTSAEADGRSTVGVAGNTGIRSDLSITLKSCTDRCNTLDDGHAVGVGDVKTDLSLDLSLEGNANTGATLKSATDTSADAGKLCVEAGNNASCELAISLEANAGSSRDTSVCASTAVASEATENATGQTEASTDGTSDKTLDANTTTDASTTVGTNTCTSTSTTVTVEQPPGRSWQGQQKRRR
jgi:hypothetical protein